MELTFKKRKVYIIETDPEESIYTAIYANGKTPGDELIDIVRANASVFAIHARAEDIERIDENVRQPENIYKDIRRDEQWAREILKREYDMPTDERFFHRIPRGNHPGGNFDWYKMNGADFRIIFLKSFTGE